LSMTQLANRHPQWQALAAAASELPHLRELFGREPNRFTALSASACGIVADFSKQRWTLAIRDQLIELVLAQGLVEARAALFAGAPVNGTEKRPAWHTALRIPATDYPPTYIAVAFAMAKHWAIPTNPSPMS
jgi:glucose-6-phosphate isomerase